MKKETDKKRILIQPQVKRNKKTIMNHVETHLNSAVVMTSCGENKIPTARMRQFLACT